MPADIENYRYFATVNYDEVCEYIYSDDSPLNSYVKEHGAHTGSLTAICAGIGLGGAAATGGASMLLAGLACASTAGGCFVEGIISESTPCGDVKAEMHASENLPHGFPPVFIVIKCESGLLRDEFVDAYVTSVSIANELSEAGGDIEDEGEDLMKKAALFPNTCGIDCTGPDVPII